MNSDDPGYTQAGVQGNEKPGNWPRLRIPRLLWRTGWSSEDEWLESARQLYQLMCRQFDLPDLGGMSVLDMGCGTKLSKILIDEQRPVGRYAGVDVNRDVIDFLQQNVRDKRFSYHHIDVRNDLYNPTGTPLTDYSRLPLNDEQFDIICLFSVFTHLAPRDYHQMLRVLRPHIKPGGRLIYSLFLRGDFSLLLIEALKSRDMQTVRWVFSHLHEALQKLPPQSRKRIEQRFISLTGRDVRSIAEMDINGHGEVSAAMSRDLLDNLNEKNILALAALYNKLSGAPVNGYFERVPDEPLQRSTYYGWYAFELINGTGWEVMSLNPPEEAIQHYFICCPDEEHNA